MSDAFRADPTISPRCHIPWQQMVIDSTGAVNPCAYYGSYGNFNKKLAISTFSQSTEIWNGGFNSEV